LPVLANVNATNENLRFWITACDSDVRIIFEITTVNEEARLNPISEKAFFHCCMPDFCEKVTKVTLSRNASVTGGGTGFQPVHWFNYTAKMAVPRLQPTHN